MVDYTGMAEDDNCDEFEITAECEQDPETMKFDEIIGALEAGRGTHRVHLYVSFNNHTTTRRCTHHHHRV